MNIINNLFTPSTHAHHTHIPHNARTRMRARTYTTHTTCMHAHTHTPHARTHIPNTHTCTHMHARTHEHTPHTHQTHTQHTHARTHARTRMRTHTPHRHHTHHTHTTHTHTHTPHTRMRARTHTTHTHTLLLPVSALESLFFHFHQKKKKNGSHYKASELIPCIFLYAR